MLAVAVADAGADGRAGAASASSSARRGTVGRVRLADVGLLDRRGRSRRVARHEVDAAIGVADSGCAGSRRTHDVVTATPALVARRALRRRLVGPRRRALGRGPGRRRWTFQAPDPPAGVQRPDRGVGRGRRRVRGVAHRVRPGRQHDVRPARPRRDGALVVPDRRRVRGNSSEIESSPVVVDGMVVFGWDVHNEPKGGRPAGVVALDARTGRVRWRTVTAPVADRPNATGAGCGDVWGSPAVDRARRLVIVGHRELRRCASGWGRASDALLAFDLDDGHVRWVYQPHPPNHDDLDFAGAPNLFEVDGRPLVGLGNKDGKYYVVDRETGAPVATVDATAPGLARPGRQLLHRRLHRSGRVRRRHRRRRDRGRAGRRTCTASTSAPDAHRLAEPPSRPRPTRRPRSPATSRSSAAPTSRCGAVRVTTAPCCGRTR